MKRLVLAAVLGCLAVPGPANAISVARDLETIRALHIARSHFGRVPYCAHRGRYSVEGIRVRLYAEPGGGAAGRAAGCTIRVVWDVGWPWRFSDPERYCDLIVHEYGHLIGLGHSDDPNNIMYPTIRQNVTRCRVRMTA